MRLGYMTNDDFSFIFEKIFGVVFIFLVIYALRAMSRSKAERRRLRELRDRQTQQGGGTSFGAMFGTSPDQPDIFYTRTIRVPRSDATSAASPPVPRPAPQVTKTLALDLDPGVFTPLSEDQVRAHAAAAGGMLTSPWFGRRDLIPPVTDPRTLLIDKAMVGQGLLSPEELTEIHRVGDEMDMVRNQFMKAAQVAADAVRVDQEARARLKAEKKAAAAERKRLHQEAVALRRRTDIIYLGRGVSRELGNRHANVEKLAAAALPVLATPADIAAAMGLTIPRLRWLAFHSDAATVSHYVRFTVPKKSGGTRQLSAPHQDLAAAQTWILENVLSRVSTHPAAHGFVAGRSTVTNAAPHVGRAVVLNADLANFFPSVTFPRVRGMFRMLGYSPAAATILALLCTECPRREVEYSGRRFHVATGPRALPQGACTSPALSNLAARRLDARLSGIAAKLGWTYTRYADDFTFSADAEASQKLGYLLARLRHIAQDEGFAINEKKTRFLRRNAAQSVTGIVVNDRPGVPRKTARRLRAILHHARTEGLATQNRQRIPRFESHVSGMISYIAMINPKQAAPLRAAFDSIKA